MPPPQRITMADVAREAGVSVMTVSRVVNQKGEISDHTRLRIQAVIDRLGYRPSDIARSLATNRTSTIGLVIIDNSNPFFSELARGVEQIAYEQGYNVFLCNTEENPDREIAVLRTLEEKRVDGLILCSSRLDDNELYTALQNQAAAVLFSRKLRQNPFGTVLIDDEHGARLVVGHLLCRGHRSIGFLAGPPRSYSGQQRAIGYRTSLQDAGIRPKAEWERYCAPTVQGGKEAAIQLLSAHRELTGLFCYNDLTAVGALQACTALGIRVPDDLAIAGSDDIPLAGLVTPSLTTCGVPLYDLGGQVMQLLLSYIGGEPNNRADIVVKPELVVRASAP